MDAVNCNACSGKGVKINQFNLNEDVCRTCDGSGQVIPCENFSSDQSPAFRNRKCNGCHATEKQHKVKVSV